MPGLLKKEISFKPKINISRNFSIQTEAGARRIDRIRKLNGIKIGAIEHNMKDINNVFGTTDSAITLSLYNRPSQQKSTKTLKGFAPNL